MERYNRVLAEMDAFEAMEARFAKTDNKLGENRPFQLGKLAFMDSLHAKYANSANREERLMLSVVQGQQSKLIKQLYPNRIIRFLSRLLTPFSQRYKATVYQRVTSNNTRDLNASMEKAGFGDLQSQLQKHIKEGRDSFSIPVSHYVSDRERMDYSLNFSRNENGSYQFDAYKATLSNLDTKETRQHNFQVNSLQSIPKDQAYNLLSGRAIQKSGNDLTADSGRWVQLNLNDKGPDGNYRERIFTAINTRELLVKSGLKTDQLNGLLLLSLRNGERVEISGATSKHLQGLFIELNHQKGMIDFYDKEGRKLSNDDVFGRKDKATKVIQLEPRPEKTTKRIGKSKGIS